jgi:2-hydroxychromene-2-carboxylate isomerase
MHALESDRPLIVYLDIKSPYSYLAWQPTRDLAEQLGVAVDWRPFVLDIPSYLGSATLDGQGRVATAQRSSEQWSGVKYAYFDCRRYANLRGLTVRGTVKIWNTELTAIGWLWARQQGDEILERYVQGLYEPFWKRELDVEVLPVITGALADAGADIVGFEDWAQGEGRVQNEALQLAAFDAGIFGVPTFVVAGQCYFGREHLPRVAWHLQGEEGPPPGRAYECASERPFQPVAEGVLEVCIDFRCSESYGAVADSLALVRQSGRPLCWLPKQRLLPALPSDPDDASRGARHRRFRHQYERDDLVRYAECPVEEPFPDWRCELLDLGLLWLNDTAPAQATNYVQRVFDALWLEGRRFDNVESVCALLGELAIDAAELPGFIAAETDRLAGQEQALRDRGVLGTPCWLLADEPFFGRGHVPLLRARLEAS